MPELRLGLNDKVLFENTGRKYYLTDWRVLVQYVKYDLVSDLLCFLTGGKSKAVELEDVKFHQCVRLSRFDNDRTISFIPPDGEFELMSYRLNTHVSRSCLDALFSFIS